MKLRVKPEATKAFYVGTEKIRPGQELPGDYEQLPLQWRGVLEEGGSTEPEEGPTERGVMNAARRSLEPPLGEAQTGEKPSQAEQEAVEQVEKEKAEAEEAEANQAGGQKTRRGRPPRAETRSSDT
jgi:hypothetical protein